MFWEYPDNTPGHDIARVDYTYSNIVNDVMHCSVIDHFIGSDRMYNNVTEANVIKSEDNFSGHLPM